jgi:hypothetical protein
MSDEIKMKKFPSIEQFRNVIKHVQMTTRFVGIDETTGKAIYDPFKPLPTLDFVGTVKCHGSNGAVCQAKDGTRWFQSRERILSLMSDNLGFAFWATKNAEMFDALFNRLKIFGYETACIYGEWCGQGIQKGVGISQLPKMFIPFAIRVDDRWLRPDDIEEICDGITKTIYDFKTYEMSIDFNSPELAQNKLGELTMEVEAECPVAKEMGVSGIGEGVVWRCVTPGWNDSGTWFKVKGDKHSNSKVKTLASVDVEKVNSIKECAEKVVTENRLKQGVSHLQEMGMELDIKNMGAFLKWVASDAIKEEIDTIIESGLEPKEVGKQISTIARLWFMEQLNANVGL